MFVIRYEIDDKMKVVTLLKDVLFHVDSPRKRAASNRRRQITSCWQEVCVWGGGGYLTASTDTPDTCRWFTGWAEWGGGGQDGGVDLCRGFYSDAEEPPPTFRPLMESWLLKMTFKRTEWFRSNLICRKHKSRSDSGPTESRDESSFCSLNHVSFRCYRLSVKVKVVSEHLVDTSIKKLDSTSIYSLFPDLLTVSQGLHQQVDVP